MTLNVLALLRHVAIAAHVRMVSTVPAKRIATVRANMAVHAIVTSTELELLRLIATNPRARMESSE